MAWAEGKVTGQRSIPIEGQETPKTELSAEWNGKILGIEFSGVDKLLLSPKAEQGVSYAEGHAEMKTKEGDSVKWTSYGLFIATGNGLASKGSGCAFFQTASQRLSRLNRVVTVFEVHGNERGDRNIRLWEWKWS